MSTIWGKFEDQDVVRYQINNKNGLKAVVMNYGANLLELYVPDSQGNIRDVVLGHESLDNYFTNGAYLGASVLPCANRIGGATCSIKGVDYKQDANDGKNSLHSGFNGLSHKMWQMVHQEDNQIIFAIKASDGDCNMPGNREFTCSYLLTDDNCLCIKYSCLSDTDTLFNPTNHSYFNLEGEGCGTILDHELTINADAYTYADDEAIPNGDLVHVEGTPFDFRSPKKIGLEINAEDQALIWARGYDHNFCLNVEEGMSYAGTLTSSASGITMDVYTELPGIQVYTGNYLSENEVGKDGSPYGPRAGVALETQFYPNAINIEAFEQPIAKANELVEYETVFKFDTL